MTERKLCECSLSGNIKTDLVDRNVGAIRLQLNDLLLAVVVLRHREGQTVNVLNVGFVVCEEIPKP